MFRWIAVLSPVLLLAVLEAILRVAGVGYPTSFFLSERVNGEEVLTDNWQFGWRFFPRELARTPQPLRFSRHKAPGTVRVFVFGESAAMGDPEPAFGLPRMLQAMLELRFPGKKFEVINTAMTAINSHVIREIARECAPLEGDVWVIYAGNNEVVGPFGSGTVFGPRTPSLGLIRASLWVKRLRVAQLLAGWLGRPSGEWEGMAVFQRQRVPRNDPRMATVYAHFQANLEEIVRRGAAAGAQVVLSTVAVNVRDCPPFASERILQDDALKEVAFDRLLKQGVAEEARGSWREAAATFSQARMLAGAEAPRHASLLFHLAEAQLRMNEATPARRDFLAALEQDTLRFRADAQINSVIRAAANRADVSLVDAAQALALASPHGLTGEEFFLEHVHLNFEGNYQLAAALFPAVVCALPAAITNGAAGGLPTREQCARRLGWTDWEARQVAAEVRERLNQPPFTAQSGGAARDTRWASRIRELQARLTTTNLLAMKEQYLTAISQAPDDWVLRERLALFLEGTGDSTAAMAQWDEVLRRQPHSQAAQFHRGNLLDAGGHSAEAVAALRAVLARNPAAVEAENALGLALAKLGDLPGAEAALLRALRLRPGFAAARVNLGQLYGRQGRTNDAVAQYELALQRDSNHVGANVNLGNLRAAQGDVTRARQHYEAAVRADPEDALARFNLGNLLRPADPAGALAQYTLAVAANPGFGEARLALAVGLVRADRLAEALPHFVEAVRLLPGSAEAHCHYGVLLAKLGRMGDAANEFRETLRLDPNYPNARLFLERAQQGR